MSNKFLDKINFPSDLKDLSLDSLEDLATELRNKTIDTVSKTGGHLGAGLGVVGVIDQTSGVSGAAARQLAPH